MHFTSNFINILDSNNCCNAVNGPTHIAGHTLDLVIHDSNNHSISNLNIFPIDSTISDHSLITFSYNVPKKTEVVTKKITFRNYKKVNLKDLTKDITSVVSKIDCTLSLDNLVDECNSQLNKLHNKHCPILNKTV